MQLESDINIKDDLGGAMSVKFKKDKNINEYCARHVENFDPDRFEVVAIRVFYGNETFITLYALDKSWQEKKNSIAPGKIPVKKFKLGIGFFKEILSYVEECNFTLTTGLYPLAEMEVVNK